MGWWADFQRVWNTPLTDEPLFHDQEHCDCCVWFSELGYGVKKTRLYEMEREFGQRVNAALKTWDQLPDQERTADNFQALAGIRRR